MNQVTEAKTKEVGLGFKWRDKTGKFHSIDNMKTSHLFNTLVMIWNHNMPADAATHNYIRYTFSAFYTDDYMLQSIKLMMPNLLNRKDLTATQRRTLAKMSAYFSNHEKENLLKEETKVIGYENI